MGSFKNFIEENGDINKSLSKLPEAHRRLVKGYKIKFEPHNTLKGDDGHVGMIINKPNKVIRIASPWNYGREWALLHEIGHLVWAAFIKGTPFEQQWDHIAQNTKHKKKDENAEELFCHGYADCYCKNKIVIHHHPEWEQFIKSLG